MFSNYTSTIIDGLKDHQMSTKRCASSARSSIWSYLVVNSIAVDIIQNGAQEVVLSKKP